MKKIVVLGGGIAGVEAAIALRKKGFMVTLISERDYLYIYPISIWIPTGEKTFEETCIPIEKISKRYQFNIIIDKVVSISAEKNTVILANHGEYTDYDFLVLAVGADKMKPKGVENTLSICGAPEQSILLQERINTLINEGKGKIAVGFGGNPKDQSAVRGGPGFEFMFNLHNLLKKKGLLNKFELTFFAPMASPGARMGKKAVQAVDLMFKKLNIKTHYGVKISEFVSDGVLFEDGSKLDSDLIMFIPAGAGLSFIKGSGLPVNEAGFVKINSYCQVEGYNNIFAVGDVAALDGADWKAKQGHVAEIMARNTAHNIVCLEQGRSDLKSYVEELSILCVMDSGNGASFVYRNEKQEKMVPLPIVGHWLKKSWGIYFKLSKLGRIPRIPGM